MVNPISNPATIPITHQANISPLSAAAKATKTQEEKKNSNQLKASVKSEWYQALNKFIKDKKKEKGGKFEQGYPKINCRFEKIDGKAVSDPYKKKDGRKLRFQVAWEVEISPGEIYSSNRKLPTENTHKIKGEIEGFKDHFIYTNIEDPAKGSVKAMVNAERFAYDAALGYAELIEFALSPTDPAMKEASKKAKDEIISHLGKNNFIGMRLKDAQGNNASLHTKEGDLQEYFKFRMVFVINGKDMEAPHIHGNNGSSAWTRTAKIMEERFTQAFSEKDNYTLLTKDKQRLYDFRQYMHHLQSAKDPSNALGKSLIEQFQEELSKIREKNRVLMNAQHELDELKENAKAVFDYDHSYLKLMLENLDEAVLQRITFPKGKKKGEEPLLIALDPKVKIAEALNSRDKSIIAQLKDLLDEVSNGYENDQKAIEKTYQQRFQDVLMSATSPANTTNKEEQFGTAFVDLDSEGINDFAFFMQQHLADLWANHQAYFGFFNGEAPPAQLTEKFNPEIRSVSPNARELMTIKPSFFKRVVKSLERGILDQTFVFAPGIPHLPGIPFKPLYSLGKYSFGMLFPNSIKAAIMKRQKVEMQAFDVVKDKLTTQPKTQDLSQTSENPDEITSSLTQDRENLISDYIDVYRRMEQMENEMLVFKTFNHILMEHRSKRNVNNIVPGDGFGHRLTGVLLLNNPGDWDYAQMQMERKNTAVQLALSKVRSQNEMEQIERDEQRKQTLRPKFVYPENLSRTPPKPPGAPGASGVPGAAASKQTVPDLFEDSLKLNKTKEKSKVEEIIEEQSQPPKVEEAVKRIVDSDDD